MGKAGKTINAFLLLSLAIIVYISLSTITEQTIGKLQPNPIQYTREIERTVNKYTGKRPLIVLGILTTDGKSEQRNAQRKTWLSTMNSMRYNLPFRIEYKFWFDLSSPESEQENNLYGDIEYLNITTHGWAVKYGEKMYVWLKYVHKTFPDAFLVARMDDDVFLCVPQIFDFLNSIKTPRLYYGWCWGKGYIDRFVDEMFVVLGGDLVTRISARHYCGNRTCNDTSELLEAGFGSQSVSAWLEMYNDVDFILDNERLILHLWNYPGNKSAVIKPDFCKKYLLHHKSFPINMTKLHEYNTVQT